MSKSEIEEYADKFLNILDTFRPAVVLTGAGVSTASGIPDFRGPDGLYNRISPKIFELEFFLKNPDVYYSLAMRKIHDLRDVEPNTTHELLRLLEEQGFVNAIITQNIDGLHQKAGSMRVIELHGNANEFYCMNCRKYYSIAVVIDKVSKDSIPHCSCGGLIRPDIVFFGESLPESAVMHAQEASVNCNLFVVMGSSLVVFPAAGFPRVAVENGAYLLIINRGETGLDYLADMKFNCDLESFSKVVIEKLGQPG
ncbi:NAD-dependent protein deacylase [Kosmotoga pacifica]|uniref:NAD-dependent protein deacylase n=1 Tax=Kosmotoga pacifica TaxID=1330330 RepID=UPI001FDF58A5|nr:NAD-dependent protein deacylase [Kosmotoga pacifica]